MRLRFLFGHILDLLCTSSCRLCAYFIVQRTTSHTYKAFCILSVTSAAAAFDSPGPHTTVGPQHERLPLSLDGSSFCLNMVSSYDGSPLIINASIAPRTDLFETTPFKPQVPQTMRPRIGLSAIPPLNTASCSYSAPMSPSGRHTGAPSMPVSEPPTEVVPRVYLADLAAAENASVLAALGITHVLSAMRGTVALPPTAAPLKTLQLPLTDSPFAELAEHLPRATAFIADALQDPRARVLVHCVQGISRSASVVAAHLVRAYGWAPAQAVQYVKSKRPSADPNPGFVAQLGEYADALRAGAGAVHGQGQGQRRR